MDIYSQKSRWKFILLTLAAIILIATTLYVNYLANELSKRETDMVELFAPTIEEIQNGDINEDIEYNVLILDKINKIPTIIEDGDNGNLKGYNFNEIGAVTEDQEFLETEKTKTPYPPIVLKNGDRIFYKNSRLYDLVTYFPLLQVLLISIFIGLGYYLFSNARKSEQNRVWAGMAKETAHQLGTPISAIIGWIEHLKESNESRPEQMEILGELRNDVNRLELIADRFSKIGSAPVLEKSNINEKIQENINYMSRRAPKRIQFKFTNSEDLQYAKINAHLFDWVIENLYRNALDAMEADGSIETKVFVENNMVAIDIIDSGKGIPSSKFKTVFQPGYSTKKRGWGLGLSLAKRIIENYHSGKIFVKDSKQNAGTTFSIRLPQV